MRKMEKIHLTQFAKHGGCAAKVGPDTLGKVLGRLPKFHEDNLLVGFETSDDAAVYKLSDDTAVIQTLDFFTPVVDDPYTFGQIAAANALSDVYAMGGEPKIALNIVCFPGELDPDYLGEILQGGAEKVLESGAVLVGGHSIQDDVPKYGLSVMGLVHPNRIYKNFGCKKGDVLILTKQLGSGYGGQSTDGFGSCRERSGCRDDAVKQKGKGNTGQVYDPCMYRRYRVRASRTLRGNGFGEQSEDRALAKRYRLY